MPSARSREEFDEDGQESAEFPRPVRRRMMAMLMLNLLRHWYWIVCGLILGVLAANYYLAKTPPRFTATASLLIKQQTTTVMQRDQVDAIDLRSQEAMATIAARITRMELLKRVATRSDVRRFSGLVPPTVHYLPAWLHSKSAKSDPAGAAPPPPDELAAWIDKWLAVSIRRGTRLLDISITHPVPEVAKGVADAIAREYLAEIANDNTQDRSKSITVLENKSTEARMSLRSAESILEGYTRSIEISKALDQKELEGATLERRYLPRHPRMIAINSEISQLRESFIREFEVARDVNKDQIKDLKDQTKLEMICKELPAREKDPDQYIRAARQQLLACIRVLDGEIKSSTLVFNSMLTRIQETGVNRESSESSAELSEFAGVPGVPSEPNVHKVLATGAVAGLAAGFLLVLVLGRLNNKFHIVSQVLDETGICVLGAVSDIKFQRLADAVIHERKGRPGNQRATYEHWHNSIVFRSHSATSTHAEMFRSLRASIALLGDRTQRKITLFTSSLPGEGKTLTATNFAASAAQQGRKTLLIDLDLCRPKVHEMFGISGKRKRDGITECLANLTSFEDAIFRDTGEANLHLILSGKRPPNAGELLESGRLGEILDQACRTYDVVVLDTAPILAVADTRFIAPLAHNVCFVVRAGYVSKGAVRRTLAIIEEDGIQPSGIIFNGYKERRFLMGENYSYGYYKSSRTGRSSRYRFDGYRCGET